MGRRACVEVLVAISPLFLAGDSMLSAYDKDMPPLHCLKKSLFGFCLVFLQSMNVWSASERPNILFIMSDDHTSQAWGCYGSRFAPVFQTPHIDRLAKEGALLRNCFVTNSICVPSRASILTGQYSHINGVKTLADSLDPQKKHLAHYLREAGYQTALIGKWHLKSQPTGFDYWNIIKGQGRYREPRMFEGDLAHPQVEEDSYSTDLFTEKALDWLSARKDDRPFAMFLHYKSTHEPWQYPPRHKDLFDGVSFDEPESLMGQTGPKNSRIPGWPLEILTERMVRGSDHGGEPLIPSQEDPQTKRRETYQKLIRDYLRCATTIDENIGKLLNCLDENDLTNNTLVIYTSDQGYFLGEHNYFDKRFMLEESLRMPFVIRLPDRIPAGAKVDPMILNVDFAPMLLDYAGQATPPSMQGESFRSYLELPGDEAGRGSIYYRYWENSPRRPSHYGIRTQTAKLIYYDGLAVGDDSRRWEFYDLREDPQETYNLYDRFSNADLIGQMKHLLRQWRSNLGDMSQEF